MSETGDLARLQAIIDTSGVSAEIEARLPVGVRRRQLQVRTLMLGILICLADHRPAHLRRIHRSLIGLPKPEKHRLGVIAQWKNAPHELTYRQTERTFRLVNRALEKDTPDGRPAQALCTVMDRLLQASVQVLGGGGGVPRSSSYAIDWSDYESFARPPRKRAAQSANGEEPQSAASAPGGAEAENADSPQEGQKDSDEDEQGCCTDPEAAWGHRKTNHPAKAQIFYGYYLQAATIVKEDGGPEIPELVARITLASCKEDPPAMIVPMLERMHKQDIKLGDLLADSGYAYRTPETFAMPMRTAGAKLVMDLHPNDRGIKGTHQGAIIANGNLYCPATPRALFELGPPAPGATEAELAAHDQNSAELARHKLSALTATDQDGYHRAICPAAAGKLRCPLRPTSMSLSHEHPTITKAPEHPPRCCTQQTITVPPTINAKTAQKHDYPSKAHRASYARRTAAERTFSRLNDPAATDISRGWCRLLGLTPNALMLTCAFITANIRTADAFTARQAENERRAARGLAPKRRARRRRSPHDLIAAANAPPAQATAQAA